MLFDPNIYNFNVVKTTFNHFLKKAFGINFLLSELLQHFILIFKKLISNSCFLSLVVDNTIEMNVYNIKGAMKM